MPGPHSGRMVGVALRCYPARWRKRHEEEAADLARLLISDGVPASSLVWSYLTGAARERCASSRRLGMAVGAALVAASSLGIQFALLSASAPASAASSARTAIARIHCSGLVGETVSQALPALRSLDVRIVWSGPGGRALASVPASSDYVAGGSALSPAAVAVRVTTHRPAIQENGDNRGQHC